MGRHSAPDDDGSTDGASRSRDAAVAAPAAGRHVAFDSDEASDAAGDDDLPLPGVEDDFDEVSIVSSAAAGRDERRPPGESGTRADLRLLRARPAVRAQGLGAVVACFALYTLVMLVIGRDRDYLLWVWIPILLSGVLVGAVLDLAHRRERGSGRPQSDQSPRSSPSGTTSAGA